MCLFLTVGRTNKRTLEGIWRACAVLSVVNPHSEPSQVSCTTINGGSSEASEIDKSTVCVEHLFNMFQNFIQALREREELFKREAGKQEQRWHSLQCQFGLLQE